LSLAEEVHAEWGSGSPTTVTRHAADRARSTHRLASGPRVPRAGGRSGWEGASSAEHCRRPCQTTIGQPPVGGEAGAGPRGAAGHQSGRPGGSTLVNGRGAWGALSGPGTEGERQAGSVVTRDAAPGPDRGLPPAAAHPPWRGHVLMSTWPPEQLDAIRATDDFHISPYRAAGTTDSSHSSPYGADGPPPGTPTWIWSVVVDGDVYVRAYNGTASRWHQSAMTQHAGRIRAGGIETEVTFTPVDGAIQDRIDAA